MAKIINITNGTGTGELINDTYTITADVNGYENNSINPNTINVVEGTNSYNFTIAANGTLTLHVTEEGTSEGTPIVGATFIRCDSNGTEYGNSIVTDTEGNAVFNNVPYAQDNAPSIYYKQTASDGEHEFVNTLQTITMTSQTQTIEIQNPPGATRTIQLTDANYENLPIATAAMTFTN